MIYNLVSSKEIVGRLYRTFRLQGTDWINSVPEWIGDVYGLVGGNKILEPTAEDLEIDFFQHPIPCGLESIEAIEYQGQRLKYGGDVTAAAVPILGNRTTDVYRAENPQSEIIGNNSKSTSEYKPVSGFKGVSKTNLSNTPFYTIKPGYIVTSFENGTIRVHYNKIAVDEAGFPKVPDNVYFKKACEWYILSMILAGGIKHPVFTYPDAEARSSEAIDDAYNKCNFPSFDRAVSVLRAFTTLTPNIHKYDDFGAGSENYELFSE